MDCLVDTNVISDLMTEDLEWLEWSLDELSQVGRRYLVNPMIYAELCCRAETHTEIDQLLEEQNLEFCEVPRKALFLAAQAFLTYRKRGGTKTAPLPDFFIGSHAACLGIPILTRDTSRYQSYFPSVELICP